MRGLLQPVSGFGGHIAESDQYPPFVVLRAVFVRDVLMALSRRPWVFSTVATQNLSRWRRQILFRKESIFHEVLFPHWPWYQRRKLNDDLTP